MILYVCCMSFFILQNEKRHTTEQGIRYGADLRHIPSAPARALAAHAGGWRAASAARRRAAAAHGRRAVYRLFRRADRRLCWAEASTLPLAAAAADDGARARVGATGWHSRVRLLE